MRFAFEVTESESIKRELLLFTLADVLDLSLPPTTPPPLLVSLIPSSSTSRCSGYLLNFLSNALVEEFNGNGGRGGGDSEGECLNISWITQKP
jgi:hypothetical protein